MSWKPTKKKSRLPRWIPEWLKVCINVCFRLFLVGLVAFLAIASYFYYKASQFDLDVVANLDQHSVLLDAHGEELAVLGNASNKIATYEDLPEDLKNALLAREDSRFFEHCGVDFYGLGRATVRNIKDLSFTQGASTLTMQLARNTYEIREKSLQRKLLEIALTLRIEAKYDKDEIMSYYLNRIYFGEGCYSIEEAAQHYFGVPTSELDLGQCAMIVGIIRGPHIFNPHNNLQAAIEQRNQVLARMVDIGKITQDQADAAMKAPLKISKKNDEISARNYAQGAIISHLSTIIDEQKITEGGLKVATTIDAKLQASCEKSITSLVAETPDLQAASIIIDNKTGAVLSIVGGRDYRTHQFNIALKGKTELGDAFTPFIYLAALERRQLPIKNQPVKTGKQIGKKETISIAKRLGLNGIFLESDIYNGSVLVSPLQAVTAFSVIGNEGSRPQTHFIKDIKTAKDLTIFKNSPESVQVVEAGNSAECLKLLSKQGKVYRYTSSSTSERSLWVMATNKAQTAVIWVGYDIPRDIPNRKQLLSEMNELITQWLK
ncbi:penicillin-binding protein 2D [Rubritalea halochordaticola]|uniref:Penicillin-binding protein 2D n=1 Tax=Rubritalea halochordaticola TaxID=714537 RepID=A0ABP9UWI1_9BACT